MKFTLFAIAAASAASVAAGKATCTLSDGTVKDCRGNSSCPCKPNADFCIAQVASCCPNSSGNNCAYTCDGCPYKEFDFEASEPVEDAEPVAIIDEYVYEDEDEDTAIAAASATSVAATCIVNGAEKNCNGNNSCCPPGNNNCKLALASCCPDGNKCSYVCGGCRSTGFDFEEASKPAMLRGFRLQGSQEHEGQPDEAAIE